VHGVGAINIDGCRVGDSKNVPASASTVGNRIYGAGIGSMTGGTESSGFDPNVGRWPANVMHDGSDVIVGAFPDAPGQLAPISYGIERRKTAGVYGEMSRGHTPQQEHAIYGTRANQFCDIRHDDTGSAARFFYCAKASMDDREQGLEDFELIRRTDGRSTEHEVPNLRTSARRNPHPTVKPVELMQWLCRLVTPKGGLVLDPFMGSGSTGKACMLEGFRFVGMDLTPEYEPVARARITWAIAERYRLDPFGFNEWIKSQDGEPMGQDWQTWSAALYLYAAKCVEEKKTPFFEEMRNSSIS